MTIKQEAWKIYCSNPDFVAMSKRAFSEAINAYETVKASEQPSRIVATFNACPRCSEETPTTHQPVGCSYEVPFRRADHLEAMSDIMRICKRAMNKTVGEPWVALDKINRLASRQLLLMKTPMVDE